MAAIKTNRLQLAYVCCVQDLFYRSMLYGNCGVSFPKMIR